jgi:hypothetical protein
VEVYFGSPKRSSYSFTGGWRREICLAERLLIHAHGPAYNSTNIMEVAQRDEEVRSMRVFDLGLLSLAASRSVRPFVDAAPAVWRVQDLRSFNRVTSGGDSSLRRRRPTRGSPPPIGDSLHSLPLALRQMAVGPAIKEINAKPDREPDHQPVRRLMVERSHHRQTHQYAQHRHQRRTVGPRQIRAPVPHHHDAGAHDHKRQQRADTGHVSQLRNGQEARKERNKLNVDRVAAPRWGTA